MRTLCLKFSLNELKESQAELFLSLTPFLKFRENFLFLEISSTSHLLGGEGPLLRRALQIAKDSELPLESWSLTNSPYGAQAFCKYLPNSTTSPLQERLRLEDLPLEALFDMQGLKGWDEVPPLRSSIDFFYALGFHKIGQILSVSAENFQWRWGKTGQELWRKLHQNEIQKFSFFIPTAPLKDYGHFDFRLETAPLALLEIEKILKRLVLRLENRNLWALRWNLHIHCEFSQAHHKISLQPSRPHRDLKLVMDLLSRRFESIDFSNPIQEVEVELETVPEKILQLDFFEPRTHEQENQLHALLSLLSQEGIEAGFYQTKDEILPEESFELSLERKPSPVTSSSWAYQEGALRYLPCHSEDLQFSPRPCAFLKAPRKLKDAEVHSLHFLSSMPLERLQKPWWQDGENFAARDYFIAHSPQGQRLWIFQDTETHGHYLHGYFD